ncbi:unnamed protein product [Rotaria magnacalcarata]|uniref:Uncharacterized protein n=2 Tax=Rotaria magnacalcarata TaxID=392030 RepID=A0A814U3E3_9BILA|nr:unnamed protein product [Rotaria magnacalcarata]CAF1654185.1 unnamed protein product [Rotaria magnacalcarata]CAF4036553.1 unnamed protein product [Rotaria magnacalcarata]CAF4116663.1 unnamed protein product [Rotaria magnacalcarata]
MNRDDVSNHLKKYQRQNSRTDLHEAILKNCRKCIENAIENGIPIDLVDHNGQSPLYYACEKGYFELVDYLLEHGARHDITDVNQQSPLWIASKKGYDQIVLLLLEKQANPNERANDGTTPIYHSCYAGHEKCVVHLTSHGGAVNLAKNSGASPLFVACRNGHHSIVQHLLRNGADPSQTQKDFRSVLHTALLYNRKSCVRILFEHCNPYSSENRDIYGWTHLHFLAKKGGLESAEIFFDYLRDRNILIDLNQQDVFGNTALHIAIFNQQIQFAKYLMRQGSNPEERNHFGWTSNDLQKRSEENADFLQSSIHTSDYHSVLFKQIIDHEFEEEIMDHEIQNYIREIISYIHQLDPLFSASIIPSGSFYERTKVGLPDEFDYMINLDKIQSLSEYLQDDKDPPGFAGLTLRNIEEAKIKLESYLEPVTQRLSAEKIRLQFYRLLTSARAHVISKDTITNFKHLKFEWTSTDKRCGTAVQAEWYGTKYPHITIKIDVVPCLTINQWPRTANIPCPFEKARCHLIARSPNHDQTYLWRISTSTAELFYLKNLHYEQLRAYLILKSLRILHPFSCEIDRIKYNSDALISSYMIKTELFYETTRCPRREQWTGGNLNLRILTILKHLQKHLLIGSIKSFYIKDYNIIDLDDYKRFRTSEIRYIRLLFSQFREKTLKFQQKSTRRHTFTANNSNIRPELLRIRSLSGNFLQF